jgi:hypothetical protein
MKKLTVKILFSLLLTFSAFDLFAQSPGPPPPPSDPGGSGNQTPTGGQAPLGNDLGLLLAMGVAYGGKKVYHYHKHKKEEN